MVKVEIREPLEKDIQFISDNLRYEDEQEVRARGFSPYENLEAIQECIEDSVEAYVVTFDGLPVSVFGLVEEDFGNDDYPPSVALWMLGTNESVSSPRTFHITSKTIFDSLHKKYDIFMCQIYSEAKTHIKWLKRLGFKFHEIDAEPATGKGSFLLGVLRLN